MTSKNGLIVIIILFIVILGGAVYYLQQSNNGAGGETSTTTQVTQTQGNLSCKGDQIMLDDGVYIYTSKGITKTSLGKIAELKDKPIIMLFYNNQCPHCRDFDPTWCQLVETSSLSSRYYMVKVVCDWFTTACTSQDAQLLFTNMGVRVSPTMVIAKASGKSITGIRMLVPGDPVGFTYKDLLDYLSNYTPSR
ncbi:MAG: protein disulfide isomerase family protein [Desulfurococcales archaeon]|nr:protein disulfide isomerase family protein [Desulfurococcales archaeon]